MKYFFLYLIFDVLGYAKVLLALELEPILDFGHRQLGLRGELTVGFLRGVDRLEKRLIS